MSFDLDPIGFVRSSLKDRSGAPRQGSEGAPDAVIEIRPEFLDALDGLAAGQDIWIFTWLHQARRATLRVHPRGIPGNPLTGVFATRSPDRPNPVGLHRSRVLECDPAGRVLVEAIEAIDGTPVIDIKPVLECRTVR